jgi:uncharacterized paraquat-inducible protein A
MKSFAARMAAMVTVCLFSAGAAFASAPAKAIVIDNIAKTKAPVTFSHKSHEAQKCVACHHKGEAGKEQACTACHTAKAEGKRLDLKEAFHKHCRDCHKAEKKGPTACNDCHKAAAK